MGVKDTASDRPPIGVASPQKKQRTPTKPVDCKPLVHICSLHLCERSIEALPGAPSLVPNTAACAAREQPGPDNAVNLCRRGHPALRTCLPRLGPLTRRPSYSAPQRHSKSPQLGQQPTRLCVRHTYLANLAPWGWRHRLRLQLTESQQGSSRQQRPAGRASSCLLQTLPLACPMSRLQIRSTTACLIGNRVAARQQKGMLLGHLEADSLLHKRAHRQQRCPGQTRASVSAADARWTTIQAALPQVIVSWNSRADLAERRRAPGYLSRGLRSMRPHSWLQHKSRRRRAFLQQRQPVWHPGMLCLEAARPSV